MISASRVRIITAAAALLASATVATLAGPVQAAPARPSSPAAAATAARTTPATTSRHVVLSWKGAVKTARMHKTVMVPSIGPLTLTCRPNLTTISLKSNDRARETQMWMAKYEDKSYGRAVAVKTVRIYRWANANDDGRGGTSNPQHEGLNQRGGKNGVENYEKGYAHGVISTRPGRNRPAGDVGLSPVTTFELTWYWNGFDYGPQYRSCKFDLRMVTADRPRLGVEWHGNSDAAGNENQQVDVPGLGTMRLTCETGRDGDQLISLEPDDPDLQLYAETVSGEGRVEDHVDARNRIVDPETGLLGPLPIPRNGMMRLFFKKGNTARPYLLSSYQITNNATHPGLNLCEVAMGPSPA